MSFKLLNLLFIAFSLTACSQQGEIEYLNGDSKSTGLTLTGKALMFEPSSSATSLSNQTLTSCSNKKVSLHRISSDGSIDSSPLAETTIAEDGTFTFTNGTQYPLTENISYILLATGCDQIFSRPLTAYQDQDISMGTTFLGLTASVENSSKLTSLKLEAAQKLLSSLSQVNTSDLTSSYQVIFNDSEKKKIFEEFTGISLNQLKSIAPQNISLTIPSLFKEGQTYLLEASALHWYSDYSKAYKWTIDGQDLSNSHQLFWSLNKNSQGSHSLTLTVGEKNSQGSVDLSKPVLQKTYSLQVENTFPPVAPSISIPTYVSSTSVTVGVQIDHCDTFSSFALVEGFLSPTQFNRTCTTTGTQNEVFNLSSTSGTKYIALWVKDASGNISSQSQGGFITLDQTAPSIGLSSLSGPQTAGSSASMSWTAGDASGLATLSLKYSSDGVNFSTVADLLQSSSPYLWTVPFDQTTTAKLQLVATDQAGNTNSVTTSSFTIDASVPGPPSAVLSGAPTLTNSSSYTISIAMSEAITGLTLSDFTVVNGTVSNLVQINQASFTVAITPSISQGSTGTVSVKIPAGAFIDSTGNPSVVDSNTLSTTVDYASPSVTISSSTANPTSSTISGNVAFSENVSGFDSSDLDVTNAVITAFSGSGASYSFTLTPIAQGTVSVRVLSARATDEAGNSNTISNTLSYSYDSIQPSITLSSSTSNPTNGAISVTATFSESVTGFDSSDITVTNATVGSVSGSGTTYTFTVTPTIASGATGTVTISVAANRALDSASNFNLASNTLSYSIDKVVPTVTLSSSASNPTNGTFTVTATFSKSVTGFDSTDITVTNATVSSVSGTGTTYAFNVAPTIASGASGTVTVEIASAQAQDSVGNTNSASNTLSYTIDKVSPTVTLTSSSADPTNSDVTISVSFSENVTGFDSSDVTITNGQVSALTGSGSSYTLVVSHTLSAQSSGTLSVQVPAGGTTDSAGNSNTASNTLTRTINTQGPTVTLASAASDPIYGNFTVTATLSLSSSDFTSGDISVSGGSVSNFTGSGTNYSFTVIPNAQGSSPGTVAVSVAAGTLHETTLGNPNTVSNTISRTVPYISQSWSTNLSSSDSTNFPVSSGVASLSSTNLTQTDFSTGTHAGTTYDATAGKLTLDSTSSDINELNSTWTPQWSYVVNYWKMNRNWLDSVGGMNGTSSGAPTFISKTKVGEAGGYFFSGSSQTVSVGDISSLNSVSQFSIGGWVKFNSLTDFAKIFGKYGSSSSNRVELGLSSSTQGSNNDFNVIVSNGGTQFGYTNADIISIGQWMHVVMVFDGSQATNSTRLVLYVNGVQKSLTFSGTIPATTGNLSGYNLSFASSNSANYSDSVLDDFAIWNMALSSSDVLSIYNRQKGDPSELDSSWAPQWSHLVGYWKMNNDWNDSTGNANNLTAFGNASFASGKMGNYSAAFDGTGDYATNSAPTGLDVTTYTVSAWINSGAKSDFNAIATKSISTSNRTFWLGLDSTTGAISLKASSGGVANVCSVTGTTDLRSKGWVFVTGVHSASSCSVYVNGILEGIDSTVGTPEGVGASLYVGRDTSSSTQDFNGSIDELAIWNTSLTGDEILRIYNHQNTKFGGIYTSSIKTITASSSWRNFKWLSSLPFFKELPGDTNANATPDSETSAEYSGVSANLSSGLEGLWHMDESSWNGSSGEVVDSSGKGRNLTGQNSITTTSSGLLSKAGNFVYASQHHLRSTSFTLSNMTGATWSAWVKNNQPEVTTKQGIAFKASSTIELLMTASSQLSLYLTNNSSWHVSLTTKKFYDWNTWHHVVATYNGSYTYIYRDGVLISQSSAGIETGNVVDVSQVIKIGQSSGGVSTTVWDGQIDEVAYWSRGLSAAEVLQLYRRGANRNKFQFRTCTQSDCSDKTDADWIGPDKSALTWFSELHNMTAVASTGNGSGTINLTAPLLDFSKWIASVSGWAFSPSPTQYFQYRTLMESDDVNNLCLDSSNNAVPCMPDITSVTPTAELNPAPYITSATGISFYTTLSSLSFTISGTCASDSTYPAKFQLSKDGGSTYQYYNGTAWATATAGNYSQASTISQINAGLSSFSCSSAPCTLMFRAYPGTSIANSCNISAPVVSVNRY